MLPEKVIKVFNKITKKPAVKVVSNMYNKYFSILSGEGTELARHKLVSVINKIQGQQGPAGKRMLQMHPSHLLKYKTYRNARKNLAIEQLKRGATVAGSVGVTAGIINTAKDTKNK
jgi:hypothetical protein